MSHVKVCGITSIDDALMCVEEGATALGVNFVPGSPRRVSVQTARAITDAIFDKALVVGVVANLDVAAMSKLREEAAVGCLQLHGDETNEALSALLPHAYKAVRVATREDVALAEGFAGEFVLVDAKVEGALGGTGKTFDWSLVRGLAKKKKLVLAGGLTPDNVAHAVRAVRPHCVDVASGVEVPGNPRVKSRELVRRFIRSVRIAHL